MYGSNNNVRVIVKVEWNNVRVIVEVISPMIFLGVGRSAFKCLPLSDIGCTKFSIS